jgi:glycosyltransferase involved in cell wall biosynthesis
MKFSIVIPVYNSEKWIEQSVNSILAQTVDDFELIILDSGSTDGTINWIKGINDSRIVIYTTDKRLSIEENWTRILTVRKNEFMTIVGHDDILYPGFLEEINPLNELYPDASLYHTHFNFIDTYGKILRKSRQMEEVITDEAFLKNVLLSLSDITATGFVLRSKDYDAIGGIPSYPNLLYADIELWFRVIQMGFMVVSRGTYFAFRFHPDNTSKVFGQSRFDAFEMLINFFNKIKEQKEAYKKVFDLYGKTFLENYVIGNSHKLLYIPPKSRGNIDFDKIINQSKLYAQKLIPDKKIEPQKYTGIAIARIIDSNAITRKLFLFYKKLHRRLF